VQDIVTILHSHIVCVTTMWIVVISYILSADTTRNNRPNSIYKKNDPIMKSGIKS
jgi:hypothetical protein